jgi:hypothetical protein
MQKLTDEKFNEIGGALERLTELTNTKILSPSLDAEKSGLEKFITSAMLEYGPELLGCYHVMRTEYIPLIEGFGGLLRRSANVGGFLASISNICNQRPACVCSHAQPGSDCDGEDRCSKQESDPASGKAN